MSGGIDSPQSNQDVDTQGNWVTRNFWILKGVAAVGVLLGLAYANLAVFDDELANVLWAIFVTLAGMVALLQVGLGALQVVRSA
ncbi:hypothetical protein [Halorussus ruber]|uniref:hypothetical protein n=1 Tax=Halorussus ruber TaxID=1126238 RepID=UPI001091BB67|nr:hypothetical protein [Halorussus ruber]